jgi:hypothetical protein
MSDARADGGASRSHDALIGCCISGIRTDVDPIGRGIVRETSNLWYFTYIHGNIPHNSYRITMFDFSNQGY